jgi:hypothetical protein
LIFRRFFSGGTKKQTADKMSTPQSTSKIASLKMSDEITIIPQGKAAVAISAKPMKSKDQVTRKS